VGNFTITLREDIKTVFLELLFIAPRKTWSRLSAPLFFLKLEFAELYVFGYKK